jgi:hypothetical protein
MTCSGNLTKSTLLQLSTNYRSSRLTPQGEYKPSFVLNIGLRQELLEDKLSAILTISDVFKTLNRKMELDIPSLNQNVVSNRDTRIAYFGLTYYFGKPEKKQKEKSLQYDDKM